ncbi:hypothetical protein DUI87_26439 [Hirundo rustica rustica]|uniref:PX domain-containing protein n=1 Tax=Hirundo rustica rustica TaxID=333673 RepID=A0A3M0J8A4_HIRRU|nr:hypothetical protein DUI87_26439 [Hirundo rustica rustica]
MGQVFKIEVLMSGRKHFVEKRYSEFHALHKKLKKFIRTPEIPSKHVRNWVPKVLEQRRQGLELYLQQEEIQTQPFITLSIVKKTGEISALRSRLLMPMCKYSM